VVRPELRRSRLRPAGAVLLAALTAAITSAPALAAPRTVCTITVNSPDEKETLQRYLPGDQYRFVELVERGRPDWLASACRQGVRCDLLVISGHFDSGSEFYSDRLGARESLPVAEMERVSCSDSCPGLFSQLKEVYLFGCNTLNADVAASTSPEAVRSLVRAGHSPAEAERLARVLDERHGDSSRDRMQRIFRDVPVIYGFSSLAPLGPTAAGLLDRYLESASTAEIGSGRASAALLRQFADNSMIVTRGLDDADPRSAHRRDVCRFVDDRSPAAAKLEFIDELLHRDMAEVRMFLDRLEAFFAALPESERHAPSFVAARERIARDQATRERYLRFAADADEARTRARMIALAVPLGWLSADDQRVETLRMIGDLLARDTIDAADVDLVCTLNDGHGLDGGLDRRALPPARMHDAAHAAVAACLGGAGARAQVLAALTSSDQDAVAAAQVYLRHRPIADVAELRGVASDVARMTEPATQVRALDALARQHLDDRQSLDALADLFPHAKSLDVQRAIASVLIRADYQALARSDVLRVLTRYRMKSPDGRDIIDILIRRLQMSES
jgi:hypothetical protein